MAEVERLRRAKATLVKIGGGVDEAGRGAATSVLHDTRTFVVEMLDKRIATLG